MTDETVGPYKVSSLAITETSDPVNGSVEWDAPRSIWNIVIFTVAIIAGPMTFSWDAFLVFFVLLELTMLAGHSIGFHRRLIHRTFECPKWLERILVWLGVLVGMHGPFWVIKSHDIRDWAQRQKTCHPYLRHANGVWMDGWWNLHCRLVLDHQPAFNPGQGIGDDHFYQFLQRTWMLQQLPVALVLYFLGGIEWVVWGIFVRIAVGVSMHWLVGYFCHAVGPQNWLVDDGAVQAHDVPWAALLSMGESWHNNHHAFPASARHGLYKGQIDLGFQFIKLLEKFGLAWNVQEADFLPLRQGITPLTEQARETLRRQRANTPA
jgi:fatty-acid desaturase